MLLHVNFSYTINEISIDENYFSIIDENEKEELFWNCSKLIKKILKYTFFQNILNYLIVQRVTLRKVQR